MQRRFILGLVSACALTGVQAAGFEVFQDPTDTGAYGQGPVVIPITGQATNLNVYYRATGTPSSIPSTICDSGDGSEICFWDGEISAIDGATIDTFIPEPGVDLAWAVQAGVLRFNGGDPINGELTAAQRVGTLTVSALSAGTIEVSGGVFLTAALIESTVQPGALLAETDDDGDGVGNSQDNCRSVPNATQADGDFDSVGDACDNCPTISNPAPPGGQPVGHSTTGGQADDDCDGIGNACDTAYAAPGAFHVSIDANDITKFRGAINKTIAFNTSCLSDDWDAANGGSTACELYDVDGNRGGFAVQVDANDITAFRATINQTIATIQAGAGAGIQPSAGNCLLGD